MPFTHYQVNKWLDYIVGGASYTPPTTLYFGLFTSNPTHSTSGTELAVSRVNASNGISLWNSAESGEKTNTSAIVWPAAESAWDTVVGVGIFDAATSGNLLGWAELESGIDVLEDDNFEIPIGELQLKLSGDGNLSLLNGLLNLTFGQTAYSKPDTLYLAAYTTPPNTSGGGIEVSSSGYARVAIASNSTNFPTASSGTKSNAVAINFPKATSSWGTVTAIGIHSTATGGSALFFSELSTTRSVGVNNTLYVAIGDLDLTL